MHALMPSRGCRYDNTQLVNTYLAAYLLSEDRGDIGALRTKLSRDRVSTPCCMHPATLPSTCELTCVKQHITAPSRNARLGMLSTFLNTCSSLTDHMQHPW